jgi:hypothetical protein
MYTINRYGINGKETILDELGEALMFYSKQNAKDFLKSKGYTEEEIDDLSI